MDISILFLLLLSIAALILLFALAGLVYMVLDSMPQFKNAVRQREQLELLRHKIYQLRLSRMLSYLGIQIRDYLLRIPIADINLHIERCNTCPDIPTCDRCLRDGELVRDMHFCPNYASLTRFSRIMPPVNKY